MDSRWVMSPASLKIFMMDEFRQENSAVKVGFTCQET